MTDNKSVLTNKDDYCETTYTVILTDAYAKFIPKREYRSAISVPEKVSHEQAAYG